MAAPIDWIDTATGHGTEPQRHHLDHYGDVGYIEQIAPHVAGLLLVAVGLLAVMKVSGFRAMIAVGRS